MQPNQVCFNTAISCAGRWFMAIHLLEQMPDTLWAKSPGRAEGCYFLGVFEGGGFGVAEGDCVCVKMVAFCLEK